jgi:TRAP-type mannitol/chloroaromatic compound transport system permease small subunit
VLAWSERLEGAVRLISRIATLAVLALVALVTANVAARYLFATGTVWLQELEWHLLAPIALFGCSYALATGDHVRVDMLYERFPPRLKHAVDLLAAVVGVVVCVLLIKFSFGYVAKSWSTLEGSPDPGGLPGRFVLKALLPLGFALLLVQFAAMGLRHAARLGRPAR